MTAPCSRAPHLRPATLATKDSNMLASADLQNSLTPAQRTSTTTSDSAMNDHSPEAVAQRRRDALLNAATTQRKVAQRSEGLEEEELPIQGKMGPAQREALEEEELPIQGKMAPAQREALEEEELPIQGKMNPAQREAGPEEEELLQGRFAEVTGSRSPLQRKVDPTTEVGGVAVNDDPALEQEADVMGAKAAQFVPDSVPVQGRFEGAAQREEKPNQTGLPDNLKAGIENMSGMNMDAVKVHYNSDKPAQLNALAYAQGTDIHVGPGQEQHLPHEAWHVVQQGR